MIAASPIARCPSSKFLTMQMQPSASCARMWTVLSATIMFADKPHRLNGRMCAAILCFDDLASGYGTRGWATRAAGYRAAISCFGTFETCRPMQSMSVRRGRPEVIGAQSKWRDGPGADMGLGPYVSYCATLVRPPWFIAAPAIFSHRSNREPADRSGLRGRSEALWSDPQPLV